MELSVSSPKQGALSALDSMGDPEEQEFSEEEDDDRNHKHRRRETRSQSSERDGSEQVFTRPYRKNNRHFENGHPFREHERRRQGAGSVQRAPFDSNQRMRLNQTFSGDSGPGRGRGRDYGSWNQRDSRFSSVDLSSQMVQLGSMPPSIFGGRGLSGVSAAQNAPWPAFGMVPGVPNGGLDTLHPIGLQGTLRPPMNSSLNIGIPRPRCRDFEERGFCLRGDMCPMEHGINRIVVDDVQSLSQFNLPVSLPSAPLLAAPTGSVPVHSVGTSTLMNSKGVNGKSSKPGNNDGFGVGDTYPGAVGTDFYDPDQPLWNNNSGETSTGIGAPDSHRIDETEPMLGDDNHDGADNECAIRSSRGATQSVWGRISSSGSQANGKEKADATLNSSSCLEHQAKEALTGTRQGKRGAAGDTISKAIDLSSKTQNDAMHNMRKPSQKALRTLFVNGVPRESNRRELLLAHFQRFGKVIDIHIPLNGERAFVQFSKREEAEAALKAPDAVMGNRFIKLWWANRDSIPDNVLSSGNGVSGTFHATTSASLPNQFPVASTSKDNLQSAAPKAHVVHAAEVPSASDHPKPAVMNGPKVPPPQQKKSGALEQLKEELRKKQEMLEQKRNEFRRQLAKLEKQATGVKGELATELAAKRLKVGVSADSKVPSSRSSDPCAATGSAHAEALTDKSIPVERFFSNISKSNTESVVQESKNLKQHTRPFPTLGSPMMNRYKLDNRPTAFRVVPPLPTGLADVGVLKEHFSSYGDVSNVELEDEEAHDSIDGSDTSKGSSDGSESCKAARITFTTRCAAEKAFANGKCWQGHELQFVWVARNSSSNLSTSKENCKAVSAVKEPSDTDVLSAEITHEAAVSGNQESQKLERNPSIESSESHGVTQTPPGQESGEGESHSADAC